MLWLCPLDAICMLRAAVAPRSIHLLPQVIACVKGFSGAGYLTCDLKGGLHRCMCAWVV